MTLPKNKLVCEAVGPSYAICMLEKGHKGQHWGHAIVKWDNKRPERMRLDK